MNSSIDPRQRLAPFPHILMLLDWQVRTSSTLGAYEGSIESDLIGTWGKEGAFFYLITTPVYREEKNPIKGKDPISVLVEGQVRYQFRFDRRGDWLAEMAEERDRASVDVFHLIDQICAVRTPTPEEEEADWIDEWAQNIERARNRYRPPVVMDDHREKSLSVEAQMQYFLDPAALPAWLRDKQIAHLKECKSCRITQERYALEPRQDLIDWLNGK